MAAAFCARSLPCILKIAILEKTLNMLKLMVAMKTFSLTELNNKSGEVTEAAFRGPVDITSRGKRKFVLMTADDFDRLRERDTQRAYRTDRLTDHERESFLAGLDEVTARDGLGDD
jgi:prevent-host-death family protein